MVLPGVKKTIFVDMSADKTLLSRGGVIRRHSGLSVSFVYINLWLFFSKLSHMPRTELMRLLCVPVEALVVSDELYHYMAIQIVSPQRDERTQSRQK